MDQKEVRFPCPACQVLVSIDTTLCGMQARCPNCDEVILIPYSSPLEVSSDWSEESLKDALSAAVRPYREKLLDHQGRLKKVTEDFNSQFERMREVESASLRLQRELWLLELEREDLVAEGKLAKKTKKKKTALKEATEAGLSEATLEALAHDLLNLQRSHSRLQDDHTLYLQKHLPELREFEVLQEQLEKAQAEAKKIQSKTSDAKKEKSANDAIQKELEQQAKEHEKVKAELQAQHDKLQKQGKELSNALEDKEKQLAQNEEIIANLKKQNDEQAESSEKEAAKIESLLKEADEHSKSAAEQVKIQEELEQHKKLLKESSGEAERLSKALEVKELEQESESQAVSALKEELANQVRSVKTVEEEKEALTKELDNVQTSLTQAQSLNTESELKIESLEAAAKGFEVQINALCELQDKLEGEIKNSNLRLQKKQDQHRELQEVHDALAESEKALSAQLNTLQAELDDAKADNEQNAQLKTDLEAALITNRELQVKIGEQEADFVVLDAALHTAEIEVKKFKTSLAEETEVEHTNTEGLAEIEKQFTTLQSLMDRVDDYEAQKNSTSETQHKLEEDFRQKLEASRIKQAESEIELEKKEAELKKKDSELSAKNTEIEAVKKEIQALEDKVDKVHEEKKLLVTDAENAQALSEKLNQMEFHSEETSKRNESYTKLIEDLESENREVKARNKELIALKEKFEKEEAERKSGTTQPETEGPGETTIFEMQTEAREAAVLRSRVTRLEIELRNTGKENEQLQSSINTLRENLRVAMGSDRNIKR